MTLTLVISVLRQIGNLDDSGSTLYDEEVVGLGGCRQRRSRTPRQNRVGQSRSNVRVRRIQHQHNVSYKRFLIKTVILKDMCDI